jgi:hypothetical protein
MYWPSSHTSPPSHLAGQGIRHPTPRKILLRDSSSWYERSERSSRSGSSRMEVASEQPGSPLSSAGAVAPSGTIHPPKKEAWLVWKHRRSKAHPSPLS